MIILSLIFKRIIILFLIDLIIKIGYNMIHTAVKFGGIILCGRFYINNDIISLIKRLKSDSEFSLEISAGDIFPSQKAWIITKDNNKFDAKEIKWGFKNGSSGLIINVRSETVFQKKMFCNAIEKRRCVIPSSGFYEWSTTKEKYKFFRKDNEALFMAGIYDADDDGERFAVLTTEANKSVSDIHGRMPLILEKSQVRKWLNENDEYKEILEQTPVELKRESDFEQLKLF